MVSTPQEVSNAIGTERISTEGWPEWMVRILDSFSPTARGEVEEFLGELQLSGAKLETQSKYLVAFDKLPKNGSSFKDWATHNNIAKWLRGLPKLRQKNGKPYAEQTIELTKRFCRRFLRWLIRGDLVYNPHAPYPEVLKCINVKYPKDDRKEILKMAEVRKLVDAANRQRDRALVFCGYEAGPRVGELLSLRLKFAKLDRYGAVLMVNGKTGTRPIRLVQSAPDLQLWLNMHPLKDDPEAPLWPSRNTNDGKRKHICKQRYQELLKTCAKRAKLGKHVYPHLLRHSRATHLANVLTEAQMREFFGWSKRSEVPAKYVHLSGRDVDSALLKHHGIIEEDKAEDEEQLNPIECHRCGFKNPPGFKFCAKCSMALSDKAALTLDRRVERANEVEAKVVRWLIDKAPELIQRAMDETGAAKEVQEIANGGW